MKPSKIITLFVLVLSSSTPLSAANLSTPETKLLEEIRSKTISLVEYHKREAQRLLLCFANHQACDVAIKKNLPTLRRTIKFKNEEYRILTALSSKSFFLGPKDRVIPPTSAKLNISTPSIFLNSNSIQKDQASEQTVVQKIGQKDLVAMNEESNYVLRDYRPNPYYDAIGERIDLHKQEAAKFYKIQAIIAVQSVPFIVFLNTDNPNDGDIKNALTAYINKTDKTLTELKNLKENPLESFLIYEPVVEAVTKNSKAKKQLALKMLNDQKHQVGIQAWLERNSASLKLAAFTTCSFVGAVVQSWPVSISCGSAVVYLTGKQLYTDYLKMQNAFAYWISGTQSYKQLRTAEGRVIYSSLALFFAGQGIYSTVAKIETGLVATLNELPSTISTRFTSLTALREGGTRFATVQANFKSKDLGASIFAESAANDVDPNSLGSRKQRIFSYKDLLKLRTEVARNR